MCIYTYIYKQIRTYIQIQIHTSIYIHIYTNSYMNHERERENKRLILFFKTSKRRLEYYCTSSVYLLRPCILRNFLNFRFKIYFWQDIFHLYLILLTHSWIIYFNIILLIHALSHGKFFYFYL